MTDLPIPPEKMAPWEKEIWGVPLTPADQAEIDRNNADAAILDAIEAFKASGG